MTKEQKQEMDRLVEENQMLRAIMAHRLYLLNGAVDRIREITEYQTKLADELDAGLDLL